MSYKQQTKYGRTWKYDTFTFDVPEFKELRKNGSGYLVNNWGGKQWLYLPKNGQFQIVMVTKMDYMDKLKKFNAREKEKEEAANENRNVSQS